MGLALELIVRICDVSSVNDQSAARNNNKLRPSTLQVRESARTPALSSR